MSTIRHFTQAQKSIHFIGIGGSGMAPLANIALSRGFSISGSDEKNSETLEKLRRKGIRISIGHKETNIKDVDYVVYSAAVKENNPELKSARNKNIITLTRSKFLGDLTKDYSKLIAVSGSHGKTTTTSMIAEILTLAGKDPMAVIGAEVRKSNCSFLTGSSDYAVCEACEFMDSFLDLDPAVGVILNIDSDHLDYFGDIENEKNSFKKFAKRCRKSIVVNGEDINTVDVANNLNLDKIFYGIRKKNNFKKLDIYAENINIDPEGFVEFDMISSFSREKVKLKLRVPGTHNVSNAVAAAAACEILGVKISESARALENFTGTRRRFETIGKINGITIIDDFAHHPTEIEAAYNTIKSLKFNKTWLIFQPHTFSRTFLLIDDFAEILSKFENVILTDILPVREVDIYGVKSEDLIEKIIKNENKNCKTCQCLGNFERVTEFLLENIQSGDLILTMGGGNIYECTNMIYESLKQKYDVDSFVNCENQVLSRSTGFEN